MLEAMRRVYEVELLLAREVRAQLERCLTPAVPTGQVQESAAPVKTDVPLPPYMFALRGHFWLVQYDKEFGLLENDKGMRYLERLLSNPNRDQEALTLAACHDAIACGGSVKDKSKFDDHEIVVSPTESFQAVLDAPGFEAIHARMRAIADRLEIARDAKNDEEVRILTDEYQALENELNKAKGPGGKSRGLGPARNDKKAQQAVSRALSRVYAKMKNAHPPLSNLVKHLKASIRNDGTAFVYSPASPAPSWILTNEPSLAVAQRASLTRQYPIE
jgi:hypothetical protein